MRESLAIQVAAWLPWRQTPYYGARPYYVFVLGPVESVSALPKGDAEPDILWECPGTVHDGSVMTGEEFPQDRTWKSLKQEFAPTKPVVTGDPSKDQSKGWPHLPTVTQKSPKVVLDETVKMHL